MRTGNQEKPLHGVHFAASSHGDQDVEEARLSLHQNTDDIVLVSCSGQLDASGSSQYGSVAKEVDSACAYGQKFRSYFSPFRPSLSSFSSTFMPHYSPVGDNSFYVPLAGPRKPSLMVPDQPNNISISQDATDMEIECLDDDVRAVDNDKSLHESSAEDRCDCDDQIGDDDSMACRKASECVPIVIVNSDDDEDKAMYECSERIGGVNSVTRIHAAPECEQVVIIDTDDEDQALCECSDRIGGADFVTCENQPGCVLVATINSGDDEVNHLINTRGVSTSGVEACNIEKNLGYKGQSSMHAVLSEAGISSSDIQDCCSEDRYDEFKNAKPDNNITIPPLKICNIEDACVDKEKVVNHSSCASPIRVYEKIETKETSQQTPNRYLKDVLTRTSDNKSVQTLPSGNCWASKGNMEEGELALESEQRAKTGLGEDINTGVNSYDGLGTECVSLERSDLDGLEKDGLIDIWTEMSLSLEYFKTAASDNLHAQHSLMHECEHCPILKEDLGYVCRICGLIQKSIDTIFDYKWMKGTRTTRTYISEYCTTEHTNSTEVNNFSGFMLFEQNLLSAEIAVHPRHMKKMKPHQLEGFNFLQRNLVTDKPGGCILAHAPGSGKTFMIISFIQSFLSKYPNARPLVVLPKGIIPTWKKEFQKWQVENVPLYDFYTSRAGNRHQQLDILKGWTEQKSILFLGYKQFSNIIYDSASTKVAAACQEMLLKVPGLLILDEGHTPRNENTDVFQSLCRVQTPRKVVLSGTLFQNHVSEVFNILDLVRPKFMELDSSRAVIRRVLSRLPISRRHCRANSYTVFYESVEEMLQSGDDLKRKATVIHDLREMTNSILHYYKGDFLDELPGLVDFTVLLNLSSKQKDTIQTLRKLQKFKRLSVENAVYVHPCLKEISETARGDRGDIFDEDKIDRLLNEMDMKDGVKTKFVLNILGLCESSGEKLLVFSMYLLPLKFLERFLVKEKGWSPDKEIFLISGNSSSEQREWSMEKFNHSPDSKVLFGSIKACGEGISLVGASRVVILDVHLNPSVTRQAIGRAFRPGQLKKVFTYRLVAADSLEEEDHHLSLKKELVSKMWFEWSEFCNHRDYEMDAIDPKCCEDIFLESPILGQDVKVLYRR